MSRKTTAMILWIGVILVMSIVMNITQNKEHKEKTLNDSNVIVK